MESAIVESAELLSSKGEYELAQRLYAKQLEQKPQDTRSLFGIAFCLQERGEIQKALRVLEYVGEFLKLENVEILVWKSELLYKSNQFSEAHSLVELAMRQASTEFLPRIYKIKGDLATQEKDFEAAFEYYAKAFSSGFQPTVIQSNLGVLCVRSGDLEAGIDYFREALMFDPKNDRAWTGIALIHKQKSDWELARAACEHALEINASNRTAAQLHAHICDQMGDPGRALEYLANYLAQIEFDEAMSVLFVHLAVKQGSRSNQIAARLELERCLCFDPKNALLLAVEKELSICKI